MKREFSTEKPWPLWKTRLNHIIFGTDTLEGKAFDIVLMISITASVLVVFLDSIASLSHSYGKILHILEWIFTILFSIEYILRIISIRKPANYIISFYGIIDLLSILPTYLSLIIAGGQFLIVIRILRLLRIFRILKLGRYLGASGYLWTSIKNSRYKITVFLWFVILMVVIFGSIMYLVEGPENGFSNIPESIYWAVVTLTTVGYGDIAPQTGLGKAIASIVMIMGYAIIAVPTGIISVEMNKIMNLEQKVCKKCMKSSHEPEANYCSMCGEKY